MRAALARSLVADARAERVSPRWAWRVFWTPLVGGVLVAATFAVRPLYYALLSEDHLLEWLQFALCGLASVSAALALPGLLHRRRWLTATVVLLMALGCAGLAGEEISWGQRVFGFAGTAGLHNRQGEFNLHNVESENGLPVEELFRIIELGIGLVGALLPLLTRWQPARLRGSFWRTVSPPLFTVPCFLAVFGYRFFRLLVPAEISALVKYQEWAEICLYGGLAVMTVLIYAGQNTRHRVPDNAVRSGDRQESVTAPAAGPLHNHLFDAQPDPGRPGASFAGRPGASFAGQPGLSAAGCGSDRDGSLDIAAGLGPGSPPDTATGPATNPGTRPGRPMTAEVLQVTELRAVAVAALLIGAVTILFAFFSMVSGIAPGNV